MTFGTISQGTLFMWACYLWIKSVDGRAFKLSSGEIRGFLKDEEVRPCSGKLTWTYD